MRPAIEAVRGGHTRAQVRALVGFPPDPGGLRSPMIGGRHVPGQFRRLTGHIVPRVGPDPWSDVWYGSDGVLEVQYAGREYHPNMGKVPPPAPGDDQAVAYELKFAAGPSGWVLRRWYGLVGWPDYVQSRYLRREVRWYGPDWQVGRPLAEERSVPWRWALTAAVVGVSVWVWRRAATRSPGPVGGPT